MKPAITSAVKCPNAAISPGKVSAPAEADVTRHNNAAPGTSQASEDSDQVMVSSADDADCPNSAAQATSVTKNSHGLQDSAQMMAPGSHDSGQRAGAEDSTLFAAKASNVSGQTVPAAAAHVPDLMTNAQPSPVQSTSHPSDHSYQNEANMSIPEIERQETWADMEYDNTQGDRTSATSKHISADFILTFFLRVVMRVADSTPDNSEFHLSHF